MKNGIPSLPTPPYPYFQKFPDGQKKREKGKRKQTPSIKMPIEVNDDNTNAVEMIGKIKGLGSFFFFVHSFFFVSKTITIVSRRTDGNKIKMGRKMAKNGYSVQDTSSPGY